MRNTAITAWTAAITAAFGLTAAATADATLTYKADGETILIESRGDDVRMSAAGEADGYFLIVDGRPYVVADMGGGVMAIDFAAIAQDPTLSALSGMFGMAGAGQADTQDAEVRFSRTGRRETVAGVAGDVVIVTDATGSSEAVLTTDADITTAFRALASGLSTVVESAQSNPALSSMSNLGGLEQLRAFEEGVLRVDDEFVLQSIERTTPSAERFVLPDQVIRSFGEIMARGFGG